MVFDTRHAMLKDPDLFSRFGVPETAVKLAESPISGDEPLIVFEKRALLVRQMVYHHVAQGELTGETYLITF